MNFSTAKVPKEYDETMHMGGLTEAEAERKLKNYGPNSLQERKKISPLKIFLEQFSDFMVMVLLASTVISAFMGEITEAVSIILIVILNAVLGFIQEYRTERSMEALKSMTAPTAKVVRNGRIKVIPAEKIVPGDLIVIETGDRIPADARLVESINLQVDESILTGESIPVEKNIAGAQNKESAMVYMGSTVTSGRGKAIVTGTGMNTEMGKIAGMIQDVEEDDTPLQKRLEHLGKNMVVGCLLICLVVVIAGMIRGDSPVAMFLTGVSLAVAAIPEGLPAIVTIVLAIGVQKMLRRNALVRRLPAVETLGCASVICSDKTGTLTENRMTVRRIFSGDNIYEMTGSGYNFEGELLLRGRKVNLGHSVPLRLSLEAAALCNNASIEENSEKHIDSDPGSANAENDRYRFSGDPTELALLVAAYKGGVGQRELLKNYMRIDEIPFDSDRKCMSVICESSRRETLIFTKGAPDVIIEKCTRIYTSTGVTIFTPSMKERIAKINDSMASEALRVIAVAYRKLEPVYKKSESLEQDLIFLGLFGMMDPPRPEAVRAVKICHEAGIKTVMITGDHRITAAAVARETGILGQTTDAESLGGHGGVLTGAELDNMDDKELSRVINDISVFARVSPRHKLRIVRALKNKGHIVAMTGDGVNDAPAVKEADIGISMGITGTDVTKEASSMILMDDNFATIVAAVQEGRAIYNNIRKFIRYMLSCNIGEVLTMFLGVLFALPLPLIPIQILWVNLVTDGFPAIALGLEPAGKDIMNEKPRKADESVFAHGLAQTILFRGTIIGACTLGVFVSVLAFANNLERARTAAFATLCVTQLVHVFECKSEKYSLLEIPILNNPYLIGAVCISMCMLLSVIYIPPLAAIFKTFPLTPGDWSLIAGYALIGPFLGGIKIQLSRRKNRKENNAE